jgi:hypothetical protein
VLTFEPFELPGEQIVERHPASQSTMKVRVRSARFGMMIPLW